MRLNLIYINVVHLIAFIPTADQYLLTSRQFQVKSIDSLNNASSDELPHSIQVHFSDNIGIKQIITLIQVQGLLSKAPYEHNNVYQVENKQIKQLKKHDLVNRKTFLSFNRNF